jgi:hypothetical protein
VPPKHGLPTTILADGESSESDFPARVADRKNPMAVSKVICCNGLGLFSMPILRCIFFLN